MNRLGRVLVACASGSSDLPRLVAGWSLDGLPELARSHGVAGAVHHALSSVDHVDPAAMAALEDMRHLAMGVHLRALGDLAQAGSALDAAGLPWLVVKGPVLAESVYPEPGLRSYSDVDLVVPPAAFPDAIRALGGEVLDRNWQLISREQRGQVHVRLAFGTVADVHWHLLNHSRDPFRVPTTELFDRARTVDLNGIMVRTLDPHDTVLHLAVHACQSGGRKLVWLSDLAHALPAADPDIVLRRATDWRVGEPVAAMLHLTAAVLGTNVDPALLRTLAPRAIQRGLVAAARRTWTPTGGSPLADLVARTAGRGVVAGARVLVRGAGMRIANRRERNRHGHRLLAPVGDERDLATYLTAVGGWADASKAS